MEQIKLDQIGYQKMEEEIKNIEKQIDDIRMYKGKVAIYQGDNWHDNPELYQTESKENSLLRRLGELRTQLSNAEIIDKKDQQDEKINIGDVVDLKIIISESISQNLTVRLVGGTADLNSDIREASINSPMGKAIYQKVIGEEITYNVNGRIFNAIIENKNNNTK